MSAQVIGRRREAERAGCRRDLPADATVHVGDGIYLRVRRTRSNAFWSSSSTPEGRKELVGFQAGVRDAQSWRELLACLRGRGLTIGPELAIGDGALGFWKALEEIFPDTRRQRCWVHKANVTSCSRQRAAKAALHSGWRIRDEAAMNTGQARRQIPPGPA